MTILYLRKYVQRTLEPVLKRAFLEYPAVVLSGPRQSGKTTLLKNLFPDINYLSLELPDVRSAAANDPRGFLDLYPPPVVLDEIQYAPGLVPYLRDRIEKDRGRTGRYVLAGSHAAPLIGLADESASAAAVFTLLPLSFREASGMPAAPFPWEPGSFGTRKIHLPSSDLWKTFLRGAFPEPVVHSDLDPTLWHAKHIQDYLDRDVRLARQIGDLVRFQNFFRALAVWSGRLINLTEISRNLGIAVNTAKAWLAILETTRQVFVLRPYPALTRRRLVKTPKVYFTDVGTLCYLTGLRDPAVAASGPMGKPLLETAVLSEIVKTLVHRGSEPRVHFWRTSTGNEVDILVESGSKLIPIAVRLSETPTPAMASGIETLRKDIGDRVAPGYLVHSGEAHLRLTPGVVALPVGEL